MQSMKQDDDLRARRTRKMLQQALIDLTIEKGFSSVTVRDIAERAMVNRSTFYRYYLDKYDLLQQFMNDVYELTSLEDPSAITGETQGPFTHSAGLIKLLKTVQDYADFYRVMLGPMGDPSFARSIRQYIEKRFRQMLPKQVSQSNPDRPPLDVSISYISHAGIGVIVWWLENRHHTPEQVADWLIQFSHADINVSLK